MSAYISSLGIANPENKYEQAQLVNFMARIHEMDETEEKQLKTLYRASGIKYRYSVLKDFQMNGHYDLYKIKDPESRVATTNDRMNTFRKEAFSLSCKAIDNCAAPSELEGVTHLITVSCTGFYAPGIDYELIRHYNLNPGIERYNLNFMGCYAAINALKAAWNICKSSENATVLMVCTELCSIHLQNEPTEDNLLANALFGDGAAAVIIKSKRPEAKKVLEIKKFLSTILPAGEDDMAWNITDHGFQMKLSQYVPTVIQEGISILSDKLYKTFQKEDIKHYLIHPGGKKILKVVEEHFDIPREKTIYSHDVLREYGNMSSPTILFVMKKFMNDMEKVDNGEKILALAFGPGLTLESALLEIV